MLESRLVLSLLVLLNTVVLAGQLWPAGAPPFARSVNITFLVLSLVYYVVAMGRRLRATPPSNRSPDA